MEKIKRIGFGAQFSNGLLFGIRHYEPDDSHNYYEIHFFIGLCVLFITIEY
tara:strand:- start:1863 stop:2015 length:153 start_codon:yes stop_codon:yes gene_type:complete